MPTSTSARAAPAVTGPAVLRDGGAVHVGPHRLPGDENDTPAPTIPARRRRWWGAGVAIAVTAVFATWLGLGPGSRSTLKAFDDSVTILAALAATFSCFSAAARGDDRVRRHWALLGAASAAWTLAEVIWGTYDVVLGAPVPVPSWADLGYLGAIPLACAALLVHPALRRRRQARAGAVLDALVLASALLFLSWSLVLGPLWRQTNLSSLGGVVAIAYPFGDVVLLFLAVVAIRPVRSADRFGLWCVIGALVAMAVSDSTYTYLVERGSYATGNLVDTGWVAGYLALALGAFGSGPRELGRSPRPAHLLAEQPLGPAVAPFIPVLVALGALSAEVMLGRRLDFTEWTMALALVLLAIGRQAVGLLDSRAPMVRARADELDRGGTR